MGAAVDLGSNSVHLLVATIGRHEVHPLVDRSAFLGLGAAVDGGAAIGPAGRAALVETLDEFVATARQLGAARITLMGTEPLRRAGDAALVVTEVEAATSVPLHVLTHGEEGLLTLLGVTGGRPVDEPTLVFDIGGGSSEIVAVGPGRAPRAIGIPTGSHRLATRAASEDPPSPGDIARMRGLARAALEDAFDDRPTRVIAVGGTATNLLKVTAAGVGDRRVDRARIVEALEVLSGDPAETIAARYRLKPTRARLLAAGSVILEAVLERYAVESIIVSDAGLREGAILVADRAGRAWRDRLSALSHGWDG